MSTGLLISASFTCGEKGSMGMVGVALWRTLRGGGIEPWGMPAQRLLGTTWDTGASNSQRQPLTGPKVSVMLPAFRGRCHGDR